MPDHEPRLTGTKVCSRCRQEKVALAFSGDRKMADGLKSECRECVAEFSYRWRAKHKKPHYDNWPGTG